MKQNDINKRNTNNSEKVIMDYTEFYELILRRSNAHRTKDNLHLFYDETNNFRTFKIDNNEFNSDESAYFILGGVGVCGNISELDKSIDDLFKRFKMQSNATEIKFKHIKSNAENLLELVTKPRVKIFLNWISENENIFIHYNYMDNFYFSIVDIIDSLKYSMQECPDMNRELKERLYQIMTFDKKYFKKLLGTLGYPNVTNNELLVREIIRKLDESTSFGDDFYVEYLRQILKSSINSDLPLLENNVEGILIDNYEGIYAQCIYNYPNSHHILDHEYVIEPILENNPIKVFDKLVDYKFDDSKNNRLLQLSDLTVGILRYWMTFLQENSDIYDKLKGLSEEDSVVLKQLQKIMIHSIYVSETLKKGVGSNAFERKIDMFLNFEFS